MKKRNIAILSLITLFSINLISAFSHYGYNRFSFRGFLDSIDPSTMILGALFIIFFAIINMALGKVFKDQYGYPNRAVAGIVAFAVSTLIIYGINRYGFDIEGLFYGIGLSADLLYIILPIILLAGAILIVWRLGFAAVFLIFGLLLMILTVFTNIFYEKGIAAFIGAVLFVIGIVLWGRGRRGIATAGRGIGRGSRWIGRKYDWEREKREARAIGRGAAAVGRGIGRGSKKAWSETFAGGRGMSKRRAEKAAYEEEAKRQQQQTGAQQRQAQISQQNLKREYRALTQDNQRLFNINRRIPARGTREGEMRHNNLQRMKQVETIFNREGWRL